MRQSIHWVYLYPFLFERVLFNWVLRNTAQYCAPPVSMMPLINIFSSSIRSHLAFLAVNGPNQWLVWRMGGCAKMWKAPKIVWYFARFSEHVYIYILYIYNYEIYNDIYVWTNKFQMQIELDCSSKRGCVTLDNQTKLFLLLCDHQFCSNRAWIASKLVGTCLHPMDWNQTL